MHVKVAELLSHNRKFQDSKPLVQLVLRKKMTILQRMLRQTAILLFQFRRHVEAASRILEE